MLSPIQRRKLIFSITESQNANPEAKTLAKAAMDLIDKQSTRISYLLNSKSSIEDKNNVLYAILKPVGDSCNLRCKYCFNQSSQKIKIMSIEVLEAIIAQVLDFCPEVANFTFHGGEPLLAGIDFFETAIALQQKYAKPNQHIHNSVQINATLINEEWCRFFSKHKIKVGTSIDGPSHDSRRLDPAGRGTLSRVIKGIQTVRSHGIEVSSISVITCPPDVSPQDLFEFITSNEIYNWRANPCINPDSSLCYGEYVEGLFNSWIKAKQDITIGIILDVLYGSLGYMPITCNMSGICSLFIGFEPDGSVKPCCERSLEPAFYFGNILETNLNEILNGLKAQTFWNDRKIGDKLCDGCEWWDFCHGGCTYHRIQVDGSPTSKDHLCETYKDTFRRLTTCIDQILLEGVKD